MRYGLRRGLRFGLLGPPVLYDADGEVRSVGSGKMRALLVALLLEPGRVVSVEVLKDALWGGAPPASAQASLQNHVTRLRRLLDEPERLRAVPPGYVLRVGEGELDVRVFENHVTAARAAHAGRDWERALSESATALALWRGTPLSGLPPESGGYALVQRLTEARLLVLEWRYEAELGLVGAGARGSGGLGVGGGSEGLGVGGCSGAARLDRLAPELAALVAEHPLREAFHRLLMLVLHRTGRRAEALAVHRDLRARLVEELGVEPGTAVREAHLEILREGDGGSAGEFLGSSGGAARDAAEVEGAGGSGSRSAGFGSAGSRSAGARSTGFGPAGSRSAGSRSEQSVSSEPGHPESRSQEPRSPESGAAESGVAGSVPAGSAPPGSAHSSSAPSARTPSEPTTLTHPTPPRPAQLPPPPAHFTGRSDVQEALRPVLDADHDHHTTTGPRVAVISGMAGVGKSALALHVAHGLRERFPDGQLYFNLHGATPGMTPLTPGQALAALLRDLGTEPRRIPEHPDAAAALLRSMLAPTRTLMVLDDAAHAGQVRPLLPAGSGCAVIVTSRSPLTALDGAHRFPLAPLSDEDSAVLLRAVSGRVEGLDGGHPLVELTGRLPLALRIVAARLAARRALTPDALAGQLAATEGRLHHLEYDDLSVRRSLAVAHDALHASERQADRDAALALRRIGALDLPAYGAPLLARLTGTDQRRAEAALDRLVDVALLEETAYARYAPHDLVRDFAREIAATPDAGRETDAVSAPVSVTASAPDSMRVSAAAPASATATAPALVSATAPAPDPMPVSPTAPASATETVIAKESETAPAPIPALASDAPPATASETAPAQTPAPPSDAPTAAAAEMAGPEAGTETDAQTDSEADAEPETPVPAERALRWYAAVAARTLAAIVEPGLDRDDRGRPTSSQPASHVADVAATQPFGSAKEAFAWGDLELENVVVLVERYAQVCSYVPVLVRLLHPYAQRSGRVAEAEVLQRSALCAARRLGDEAAEAYALGDLAGLHFMTGRAGEALALNDEALAIWRRLGVLSWVRRGLNNRGMLLEGLGRHDESSEALLQSLELSRRLGDQHTEAITYSNLGNLYEHTDPRAAIDHHKRSLALGDALDDVIIRHSAHCNIGYAHLTLGEPVAALPHFEESLRILGSHGDWHGEAQTRLGLVRALRGVGLGARAARECDLLLGRADSRADGYSGGLARHQRGLLLSMEGDAEGAYGQWRSALEALDGTDTPVVGELRELLKSQP
ncbi:BTAD domain-containing putative transcriptional regulator [Streptomyces sp. NBC_00038]|uniref:AfsR/SARP family transcriptional regulator n=1 Tax=Streptomyces sp. NBC_00038 TaxID=2903615 RepID=UPI002255FB63|nr:BTAD domain-containing putative transcriptional regulator [Streptomyces sp. NBC_00038]MCX5559570.1 tetratricopeptide repeat protein [Streptomyces sp. NBC_00038]